MTARPEAMHWDGETVDNDFLPEERLFLRIPPQHTDGERLLPTAVRSTDQSVNREKYGPKPEWVLWRFNERTGKDEFLVAWAVFAIKVGEIPSPVSVPNADAVEYRVEHDPIPLNSSHSEIRAFKNDNRKADINKRVAAEFKKEFCKVCGLVRRPA